MITQHLGWRRLSRATVSALLILSINSLVIISGCSGRKSTTASTGTTTDPGTGTGTTTTDPTSTTDPTMTVPTSSTSGTSTSSLLGPNQEQLFDTDLSDGEGGTGQVTAGQVSSVDQACLSNTFGGYGDQEEVEGASSGYNNACVEPNQSGSAYPLSQDAFYDATIMSYNMVDYCLEQALRRSPRTDAEAPQAHQAGKMFLARCYGRAIRRMQNFIPWGNQAQANFNTSYTHVSVFLVQFFYMGNR